MKLQPAAISFGLVWSLETGEMFITYVRNVSHWIILKSVEWPALYVLHL